MVICTMSIPINLSRLNQIKTNLIYFNPNLTQVGMYQVGGTLSKRVWFRNEIQVYLFLFFDLLRFKELKLCRQLCKFQHCTSLHSQVICKKKHGYKSIAIPSWKTRQNFQNIECTKMSLKLNFSNSCALGSGTVPVLILMYVKQN